VAERWATFDCYGTLVDWNAGIRGDLERLFGVGSADSLLARYHELEPEIQAENPGASYRAVLTIALERLAGEAGLPLPEGETSALARSLPEWPVFPDVAPALA
jgi:2-haloacid dehalogenase